MTDLYADEQSLSVVYALTLDSDGQLLASGAVPWQPTAGYNHVVPISTNLHPDIAVLSGAYSLAITATNDSGSSSSTIVHFNQTILLPPLRQRAGTPCQDCANPECPAHYLLSQATDQPWCNAGDNADWLINGDHVPPVGVQVADGWIDNPNSIPMRVGIQPSGAATFSYGWENRSLPTDAFPFDQGPCTGALSMNPDGTCYSTGEPDNVPYSYQGYYKPKFPTTVGTYLDDGTPLLACNDCYWWERDIPPHRSIEVKVYTHSFSFVIGSPVAVAFPPLNGSPAFTGIAGAGYVNCSKLWNQGKCTNYGVLSYFETSAWFTRMMVDPEVTSSLTARLADARWTAQSAVGTSVSAFTYGSVVWNTHEDPWDPADPTATDDTTGGGYDYNHNFNP